MHGMCPATCLPCPADCKQIPSAPNWAGRAGMTRTHHVAGKRAEFAAGCLAGCRAHLGRAKGSPCEGVWWRM